jgi:hypothetical protein
MLVLGNACVSTKIAHARTRLDRHLREIQVVVVGDSAEKGVNAVKHTPHGGQVRDIQMSRFGDGSPHKCVDALGGATGDIQVKVDQCDVLGVSPAGHVICCSCALSAGAKNGIFE